MINNYPHTSMQDMNLDWIIAKVKELTQEWASKSENWDKWQKDTNEAFADLKSYVMNFFDNLDVQKEINIKLDKMADEGYFYNIFKTYKNNRKGVIIGDSYTQIPTSDTSSCALGFIKAGISNYHNLGVSGVALDGYIEQVKNYPYDDAENITDVLITGGINNAHENIDIEYITNLINQLMNEINKKFVNAQIWVGFSGNGYYHRLVDTYSGFTYSNVQILKYTWYSVFNNYTNVNYMEDLDNWGWYNSSCDIENSGIHPIGFGITQISNNIANYLKWNSKCTTPLTDSRIYLPSALKSSINTHGTEGTMSFDDSSIKIFFDGGGEILTENITLSSKEITVCEWDVKDKTHNVTYFNNRVSCDCIVLYKTDETLLQTFGTMTLFENKMFLSCPALVAGVDGVKELYYSSLVFIFNRDVI